MAKTVIKTKFQLEKEVKELAIFNEWNELMAKPGAMATAVSEHLMKKYNLHSRSSIWQARVRTAKRLAEQLNSAQNGSN